MEAIRLFKFVLRGKSVLLKPYHVEYIPVVEGNTNPVLVGAAAEAFVRLSAKDVVVAGAPGHQRGVPCLWREGSMLSFVLLTSPRRPDQGADPSELHRTRSLLATASGANIRFCRLDAQGQDPPLGWRHAEHENMFGVVPGTKYGWPKNLLHWKGIHRSILDICATVPIHFVIAGGIVAMEGNGPLHGAHRHLGKIVLSDDSVAADFTCARLMGLHPERVWHLDNAARFLGHGSP